MRANLNIFRILMTALCGRRWGRGICALSLAVFLSLAAAPPALAARTYTGNVITGFGADVNGNPDLPEHMALDGAGDVWVDLGTGTHTVAEYGPYPSQTLLPLEWDPGRHLAQLGFSTDSMAIEDSTGLVYVAGSSYGPAENSLTGDVGVFNRAGEYREAWNISEEHEGASNVAVDNSGGETQGDVLVALARPPAIEAFNENHEPVNFSSTEEYVEGNKITGTPFGKFYDPEPYQQGGSMSISTDSSGDIYVVPNGEAVVDEFAPSGTFLRQFTGVGAPGSFHPGRVAVDPTSGNLLVDSSLEVIDEFTSSGKYLGQIEGIPEATFAELGYVTDMAVNSSGYLYVLDVGHSGSGGGGVVDNGVYIFSPAPQEGPKISYEPVTEPGQHSGTLHAQIEPQPGEEITSCDFEYGLNTEYKLGKIPCSPDADSDSAPIRVSAQISGLTPRSPTTTASPLPPTKAEAKNTLAPTSATPPIS